MCAARLNRRDTSPAPPFWTAVNKLHSQVIDRQMSFAADTFFPAS
jgi:hypothetical protein